MSFSGYFCLKKNDFSSFVLIFSVCFSEIIVFNLRATLYGMFCFECLGGEKEIGGIACCYLFIIYVFFKSTLFVSDHYV